MIKQYDMNMSTKKWIHQNTIKDDIVWIDAMDGSLIDNYFIACKNGLAILKERYVNTWTSKYVLYFARYNDKKATQEIYHLWDEMMGD